MAFSSTSYSDLDNPDSSSPDAAQTLCSSHAQLVQHLIAVQASQLHNVLFFAITFIGILAIVFLQPRIWVKRHPSRSSAILRFSIICLLCPLLVFSLVAGGLAIQAFEYCYPDQSAFLKGQGHPASYAISWILWCLFPGLVTLGVLGCCANLGWNLGKPPDQEENWPIWKMIGGALIAIPLLIGAVILCPVLSCSGCSGWPSAPKRSNRGKISSQSAQQENRGDVERATNHNHPPQYFEEAQDEDLALPPPPYFPHEREEIHYHPVIIDIESLSGSSGPSPCPKKKWWWRSQSKLSGCFTHHEHSAGLMSGHR